jgi:tetratricopeptide (TPR) repeat protein
MPYNDPYAYNPRRGTVPWTPTTGRLRLLALVFLVLAAVAFGVGSLRQVFMFSVPIVKVEPLSSTPKSVDEPESETQRAASAAGAALALKALRSVGLGTPSEGPQGPPRNTLRREDVDGSKPPAIEIGPDGRARFAGRTVLGQINRALEAEVQNATRPRPPPAPDLIAPAREAVLHGPTDAGARIRLGDALLAKQRFDEAMAEYRQAIALAPENPRARVGLATALHRLGSLDQAISAYYMALAFDDSIVAAHIGLADIFRIRNQFGEALAEYGRAVASDGNAAAAYNGRGLVIDGLGLHDQAKSEFQHAARLDPKYDTLRFSGPGRDLATMMGISGAAINALRRAIVLSPDDLFPHRLLVGILRAARKIPEALAEYRRAIMSQPRELSPRFGLADLLRTEGRWIEEADEYKGVLAIDPGNAAARDGFARIVRDLHRGAE